MSLPLGPHPGRLAGAMSEIRTLMMVSFAACLVLFTTILGACPSACPHAFYASAVMSLFAIGGLGHHLRLQAARPKHQFPAFFQTQLSVADGQELSLELHDYLHPELAHDWDQLVPDSKQFMRTSYLRGLQHAPPPHTEMRYGLLRKDGEPVAVAYFQILKLNQESVGDSVDAKTIHRVLRPLASLLGEEASEETPVRLLLCGNALLSGNYGFHYSDAIEHDEAFEALGQMMQKLQRIESHSAPIPLMAIKDFSKAQAGHAEVLPGLGYHSLKAEPCMVVHLRGEWKNMDDYKAAMSSKYRKRVKSARKQGAGLVRNDLSAAEIQARLPRIQELFDNVVQKAGFRLTTLHAHTFAELKRAVDDEMIFKSYELDGAMVGFSVSILTEGTLEAHLVGMDYEVNLPTSLYQNMLYDFVEMGIERRCHSVHMGRTALEIKSCVGAEPEELAFYVKHPNPILNATFRPFIGLVPQTEWTQRRPFKD